MINILLCGNQKVFDGALSELISITNKTKEAITCYIFTMDVSRIKPEYTCIEDEQVEFLDQVVKNKNPENKIIKADVTNIYEREFANCANETAYCTPYTLLRLLADLVPGMPDKLLYLDIDMMANDDISPLYHTDIEEYEYAAVKEKYGSKMIRPDYINAGMLLLNMKKIKETKSEMISAIDNIVKFAGIIIIPIGILLFIGSYGVNGCSYEESVNSMVSALLGMIPEGLYLLTTVALALSSMRLAQNKILLHDMKSIESLARVDVLCVDKTGTITNNTMKVLDIFDKNGNSLIDKKEDLKILARYINTIEDKNITIDAIKEQLYGISTEKLSNIEKENFNSKNKFSFIKIDENVTYKLGAPEILLNKEYEELVNKRTKNGERLIAFVELKNDETIPILFISLKNEIRKNAKEIFEFFDNRNVQIRVISGDNPITVSSIAKQAGIKGYEKYIDCRELKNYADIQKAVKKYIVFGRVNPEQKRQIIKALKEQGLKVAMTGDGVNDILAMKEADCSIAIGSGSDAARGTAQVVLLDSDFGKMRNIVYEGRKNINNITRSASLFTYKNIFSLLLSIYSIIFAMQYPLEPNQVSLGSAFTIGIPAFLLTFEENQKKQQNGNFMRKVFTNSLPAAITSFLAIVAMVKFSDLFNVGVKEITTACSYLFFTGGFLILYKIIRPLNKYRTSVMFLCILGIILTINIMPNFFAIKEISERSAILVTLFAIAEFSVIRWVTLILDKYEKNRKSNA